MLFFKFLFFAKNFEAADKVRPASISSKSSFLSCILFISL